MTKTFLTACLLASSLVIIPHAAHAQRVATSDPVAVRAGTYRIEPGHTQVGFTLSHFGLTNYSGVFSGASGSLALDPAHVDIAKLSVNIPIASVQTTSAKLDGELKSADWFDAEHFPNATFASTHITRTGAGTAAIAGNLTLHGVTHPVTLSARLIGAGINPIDKAYTIGFEATGRITRSDFGIKTYAPVIGDQVTLTIAGAFEQQN